MSGDSWESNVDFIYSTIEFFPDSFGIFICNNNKISSF